MTIFIWAVDDFRLCFLYHIFLSVKDVDSHLSSVPPIVPHKDIEDESDNTVVRIDIELSDSVDGTSAVRKVYFGTEYHAVFVFFEG